MTTEEILTRKYGALLTLTDLAEVLHRSPDGLRLSLVSAGGYSDSLNQAKVRIGRRIYFRATDIALLLEEK
ncbi:plasmid-related protein [Xanthomonas massiliensis]|uniref:plasmid-related protein n=1 Tax=Xanthomonas massiliensis TaxID=1720302 RepID=UPI00098F5D26|nr:plasmid-related protein [Xanthomonas massiliensis]